MPPAQSACNGRSAGCSCGICKVWGASAMASGARVRAPSPVRSLGRLHATRRSGHRRAGHRGTRAAVSLPGASRSRSHQAAGDTGRPHPGDLQASVGRWHRRSDVHTARVRRASRGPSPAAACAPCALPWRARWPFCLAPGSRANSARVSNGAPAAPIEHVDTLSQYPIPDLGCAAVACIRGRRVALSHLRRSNDPAGRSVAARHPAHPRWTRCRCSTSTAPRRRRLRLSRSATAVGAVMCDLGWPGGPFGGPRSTTALPSRAESVREDLFAHIATQVGRPRYGAKGVGITYPLAAEATTTSSTPSTKTPSQPHG
jgi:hypothetical protein